MEDIEILKKELEIFKKLYDSLYDFGQDSKMPIEKIDYVKARMFDAAVSLNRISKKILVK